MRSFSTYSFFVLFLLVTLVNQNPDYQEQEKQDSRWQDDLPVCLKESITEYSPPLFWTNRPAPFSTKYWHDGTWGQNLNAPSLPDFSDNPLAEELCKAILEKDITRMERAIAQGADVNAISKNQISPLFLAYHVTTDPRPFECLLKNGADPNLTVDAIGLDITAVAWSAKTAPVHLVTFGRYNRLYKSVLGHGGNPNLIWDNQRLNTISTPFLILLDSSPDAFERLELLINCGANIDEQTSDGWTKLNLWLDSNKRKSSYERTCGLSLVLLKAGANFRLDVKQDAGREGDAPYAGCYFRPIHFLAEAEPEVSKLPAEEQVHYRSVVQWLEEHGESLAEAQDDLERWKKWIESGQEHLIEQEHEAKIKEKAKEEEKEKADARAKKGG